VALPEKDEAARNEILFREVNERIVAIGDPTRPDDAVVVLCECGQPDCLLQLDVPAAKYAEVRGHGARFLLFAEHVDARVEEIVHREPGFVVVEKIGAAGLLAEKTDPGSA
jgi:hypothetical protein